MERRLFDRSGTITEDTTWKFDPINYSRLRQLRLEVRLLDDAGDAAGDTLDIYLKSRSPGGPWVDRVHVEQISGTDEDGWERHYLLRSRHQPLSADEEAGEPPGAAPLSARLPAGEVRHGPFPRHARTADGPEPAWELEFDVTEVSGASFPVQVTLYGEGPE